MFSKDLPVKFVEFPGIWTALSSHQASVNSRIAQKEEQSKVGQFLLLFAPLQFPCTGILLLASSPKCVE